MRSSNKWILFLGALTFISASLTLYTIRVHTVAHHYIYEGEGYDYPVWRSYPPGSLFPWPTGSGMFQMLSDMNETDVIIYRYLVKSQILVGCAITFWIITFFWALKVARKFTVT